MTGKDTFPDTNLNVRSSFKSTEVPELFSKAVDFDGWCMHRSKGHYSRAGEYKYIILFYLIGETVQQLWLKFSHLFLIFPVNKHIQIAADEGQKILA